MKQRCRGLVALLAWQGETSTVFGLSSSSFSSSSSSSSSIPSDKPLTTTTSTPTTRVEPFSQATRDNSLVHTLLLCRHGDSIWNGGEPGSRETFTGWTNVPLSQKGIREAQETGRQVSQFELGIDACFTSILQRAQLTAHYCLWGFAEKPNTQSPRRYIQDYRLNERHYGALQGLVKEDVENGIYGHDPELVQQWRRSWHTVPPLLDDDDPRRLEEIKAYTNYCGGPERVPKGESLEQVAEFRIRPFLQERLCPVLQQAAASRQQQQSTKMANGRNRSPLLTTGGTGLVVAHANSLRALIGVICNVQQDALALKKLEALRLQTGVPLVLRFRQDLNVHHDTVQFQPCDIDGIPFFSGSASSSSSSSRGLVPELPVYPLSSIPMNSMKLDTPTSTLSMDTRINEPSSPPSLIRDYNNTASIIRTVPF